MSDQALRSKIIRLAHTNPELRPYLMPLVKEAAGGAGAQTDAEVFEMGIHNATILAKRVNEALEIVRRLTGFPGDIGKKAVTARKAIAALWAEVAKYERPVY